MSLATLDLNLLLVLDAVLTERSVARAAKRLHVTPSAVSNSLARLRAALGDPLVIRRGRGIVPTTRALELAPILSRTLRELDAAVQEGGFEPATTTRRFTLAIADVGQVVHLPRIAAELAREMPNARLRVIGVDSLVALGGVSGTDVDLAFGIPEKVAGVHAEEIFDEPTSLVARAAHPARRQRAARVHESLQHVAVDMVPGRSLRDPITAAYARAGVPRQIALTVPTFVAAAAVVAATDYVATLPTSLLQALGAALKLSALSVSAPAHAVKMRLSWHERTHADPAMIAFRAIVRHALLLMRKGGA